MSAPLSTEFTAFTTNVRFFPLVGLSPASVRVLTCFVRLGKRRYNIKLWKTFTDCFNCLPIAAIIDEKIFTMHGGLSPDLQSMEQIRRVMRPTDVPDTGQHLPFQSLHLYWVRLTDAVHFCFDRLAVRPAVVRPRQRYHRLVRERPWCLVYVWPRCRLTVPTKT